ncbi:hypothetical protein MZD04_gp395 [Pseudomonas phage Psa21]|uniref:Uncharacterized protein n=1 Tax=Pseudomonas phage Psa21 TaxID=2530023 RepID=A0A481W506_9CAUD|nr:hypothetical protein MZD04_gp395 [Pseudomonas phage Psa21]QBJ02921.1 hypothetical protein PSA21_395 [Pseudomonas phage Psa21]
MDTIKQVEETVLKHLQDVTSQVYLTHAQKYVYIVGRINLELATKLEAKLATDYKWTPDTHELGTYYHTVTVTLVKGSDVEQYMVKVCEKLNRDIDQFQIVKSVQTLPVEELIPLFTDFKEFLINVTKEVVADVSNNAISTAEELRLFVEEDIRDQVKMVYPENHTTVSVYYSDYELGAPLMFNVQGAIYNSPDHCYVEVVQAPLTRFEGDTMSQTESVFAKQVKKIAAEVFNELLGDSKLNTHEMICAANIRIKERLVERYENENFQVNVTAAIGRDWTFTIVVEDTLSDEEVVHDLGFTRTEMTIGAPVPNDNVVNDLFPVRTEEQKKRSRNVSKIIEITTVATKALEDVFLGTEAILGNADAVVSEHITQQLVDKFPELKFTVNAQYQNGCMTVWVTETTTEAKVRLRASREYQSNEQVTA